MEKVERDYIEYGAECVRDVTILIIKIITYMVEEELVFAMTGMTTKFFVIGLCQMGTLMS